MRRYSAFAIAREAFRHHLGWERAWKSPAPKKKYDVVIVGAGGHGLATAYYLGKNHGIKNVAVIEKGWLGGGNTGRNTTIIRSNYLYDESAAIYEHSVKLWHTLAQELNYNVMFSPRGVLMLAHNIHDVQSAKRHVYANRLNGVDNEWLSPEDLPSGQAFSRDTGQAGHELKAALRSYEKSHIESVLREAGRDRVRAAKLLGISRSSLYRKMEQLGIAFD